MISCLSVYLKIRYFSTTKIDLFHSDVFNECFRFFVLDEADGLLKQGYEGFINRVHGQIPKVTSDGRRLQMVVCSATLHAFEVKKMAEKLMYFPTWVDLKGQDSVPDTVHHVIVPVDPRQVSKYRVFEKEGHTESGSKLINFLPEIPRKKISY